MRIFTLAAGLATGYILGSRAGRERYEQIVTQYQKLSGHPAVQQTQEKAKQAVSSRASDVITKLDPTAPDSPPAPPVSVSAQRPKRRAAKSRTTTSESSDDLLA